MIKKMYDGIANSPETRLTQGIDANVTDIVVDNAEMLLQGENLAVIGLGADAETIKYSSINGNILVGCTRGFEGVAKSWESGIPIARNFTAYDHNTFKENVENLDNEKADRTELTTKVDKVSGKELSTNDYTNEAKNKVDAIPSNPKYTDTTYGVATTSSSGLMASTDKVKLNGVETGAEKNAVLSVNGQTGAVTTPDTKYTAGTNVSISGTTINATDTTYNVATTSSNGLMASADKVKLNELNYTRAMTQAQYDALSTNEKNRTDVWYGIYEE